VLLRHRTSSNRPAARNLGDRTGKRYGRGDGRGRVGGLYDRARGGGGATTVFRYERDFAL
jgi:hypothetical protein